MPTAEWQVVTIMPNPQATLVSKDSSLSKIQDRHLKILIGSLTALVRNSIGRYRLKDKKDRKWEDQFAVLVEVNTKAHKKINSSQKSKQI